MFTRHIKEVLVELSSTSDKLEEIIAAPNTRQAAKNQIQDIAKVKQTIAKLEDVNFETAPLTENLRNELVSSIKDLTTRLSKSITTGRNFSIIQQNWANITPALENFYQKANTVVKIAEDDTLSSQKEKRLQSIEQNLEEQKNKSTQVQNKVSSILSTLNELKKLQEEQEKKTIEIVQSGLSQAKDNIVIDKTITKSAGKQIRLLSKKERYTACRWVAAGCICIFIALVHAGCCMKLHPADFIIEARFRNDFNENIQIALLFKEAFKSIFIVSVLSSLSFMCFKQYKLHRRNHVLYEHKYFAMNAFNAFMSNTILSDTRNIIVDKAMDSIFKNPDFLDQPSNDAHERSGDIIQTIKTALPSSENK